MEVNNMRCETLHPANLIAKMYKGEIAHPPSTLQQKNVVKTKSLVGRLIH
jgi:hypothetical protein